MKNDVMDTIEGSGFPLGFALDDSTPELLFTGGEGAAVVTVEARMMSGHQKEAVVHEGIGGPRWRLTSDEGKHLNGADIAPFPLGFFNAGLQSDLLSRLFTLAAVRGLSLGTPEMSAQNFYWLTGSFVKGTSEGHCEPSEFILRGGPDLLNEAAAASPALDAQRRALESTFALYINGNRVSVTGMPSSDSPNAPDPYLTYRQAPVPLKVDSARIIRKTGELEQGAVKPAPASTDTRIIRTVSGKSRLAGVGVVATDTWLEMPGVSHFELLSSWNTGTRTAPSGLALLNAGIAFCYLTQLSRFISNMKLDIGGMRLVQTMPFSSNDGQGLAGPADTHLFLNGGADTETHQALLRVAARTCYLHATLSASLPPVLRRMSAVST